MKFKTIAIGAALSIGCGVTGALASLVLPVSISMSIFIGLGVSVLTAAGYATGVCVEKSNSNLGREESNAKKFERENITLNKVKNTEETKKEDKIINTSGIEYVSKADFDTMVTNYEASKATIATDIKVLAEKILLNEDVANMVTLDIQQRLSSLYTPQLKITPALIEQITYQVQVQLQNQQKNPTLNRPQPEIPEREEPSQVSPAGLVAKQGLFPAPNQSVSSQSTSSSSAVNYASDHQIKKRGTNSRLN